MELMTVLVVIGVLTILVLPRFGQARRRALKSQMQSDLRTLVNAQEAYFNRYYAYSDNVSNLNFNITPNITISIEEITGNGWSATAVHEGTTAQC
jgi:type II secretory pathway pseudopilin PulG